MHANFFMRPAKYILGVQSKFRLVSTALHCAAFVFYLYMRINAIFHDALGMCTFPHREPLHFHPPFQEHPSGTRKLERAHVELQSVCPNTSYTKENAGIIDHACCHPHKCRFPGRGRATEGRRGEGRGGADQTLGIHRDYNHAAPLRGCHRRGQVDGGDENRQLFTMERTWRGNYVVYIIGPILIVRKWVTRTARNLRWTLASFF